MVNTERDGRTDARTHQKFEASYTKALKDKEHRQMDVPRVQLPMPGVRFCCIGKVVLTIGRTLLRISLLFNTDSSYSKP